MYKSGMSSGTSHRQQSAVQLRKAKRQKQLSSKRVKMNPINNSSTSNTTTTATTPLTSQAIHSAVQTHVGTLRSNGSAAAHTFALKQIRKLLSEVHAHAPPIGTIVSSGGVPLLIQYLTASSEEQRLEASWSLSNIASGTHDEAQHVLAAVPYLVGFLTGPEPALREQSLWALGNLAGDGPEFRQILHANGVLGPAAHVYTSTTSSTTATTAAWALSNLAKGRATPALPFLTAGVLAPVLSSIGDVTVATNVQDANNKRMLLVESCWLLAHMTAKEVDAVHNILTQTGGSIVPLLCTKLMPNDEELAWPVLRSLGNIFSAGGVPPSHLTAAMSSPALISSLLYFLSGDTRSGTSEVHNGGSGCHRSLTKEAMWLVGNIMTGTQEQQTVADQQGLIAAVCTLIPNAPFDLRKEAAFALFNTIAHGQSERTNRVLNSFGVLETFVRMLKVPDQESVEVALRCVEVAAACGNVSALESVGCMDALENVIYHGTSDVLKSTASRLWDTYFEDGEEEMYDDGGAKNGDGGDGSGMMSFGGAGLLGGGGGNMVGMGRGRGAVLPAWSVRQ
jgi:hypothetical protein